MRRAPTKTNRKLALFVLAFVAAPAGCKRELADAPASRRGDHFSARVLRVVDGDTLSVERDGKRLRVRLFGIDAPERSQRYGKEATEFLRERVDGKTVKLNVRAVDRYGRAVAMVRIEGKKQTINEALVAAGCAWWYRRYAPANKSLAALQAKARKDKRGLWANERAVAPWHFRRARSYSRQHRRRRRRRRRRKSSP